MLLLRTTLKIPKILQGSHYFLTIYLGHSGEFRGILYFEDIFIDTAWKNEEILEFFWYSSTN